MAARYLLDTNICIYIAKHSPPAVCERLARHTVDELVMSVVTLGELRFGAAKSQSRAAALAVSERLVAALHIAPLTAVVGEHYGRIRADLQRRGEMIGNNELWLAAHARAAGWILVTNNAHEFVRVDGLQVENWVV